MRKESILIEDNERIFYRDLFVKIIEVLLTLYTDSNQDMNQTMKELLSAMKTLLEMCTPGSHM